MPSLSPKRPSTQPSGDSTVATLLTWFLPGAGHLYLGRATFGLVAFVVVEGLYLLGLKLSDGMGFEFLQQELRGAFAPALAPEAGNLGALIYHLRGYGFGPGFPRPFPSTVVLGTTLTALSGVLNLCLMCHAHFEARLPKAVHAGRRSPALAVFLAWLVPGLGHLYQGRKLRAVLVFVCLLGLLLLGTGLAETSNLSRERHYYYWGGQVMAGLPALLLQVTWGARAVTSHLPYAEAGLVIASVAGMLNILAMLDVFGWSERAWFSPEGDEGQELDAAGSQGEDLTAPHGEASA
jgi:TM2 domain-containing membrane protein YozV